MHYMYYNRILKNKFVIFCYLETLQSLLTLIFILPFQSKNYSTVFTQFSVILDIYFSYSSLCIIQFFKFEEVESEFSFAENNKNLKSVIRI